MTAMPVPLEQPSPPALLPIYSRLPAEFVRGEGVELIDAGGKRYLDFASGIAVNSLGYGDPGIAEAMQDALATGLIHVSNLYDTAPGRDLAELLASRSFASNVFFCNSGAEANEGAFKFARRWAGTVSSAKREIVALRGSFHGRLFASLAATDRPPYRAPFRPLAGAVSIRERDLESLAEHLDADLTAAVIVEPVQGESGVRVLDAGFLRELRALTRERRIALIFDEVQCGLGRTGRAFAYEHSGVEPDLLTLAKPLAGGLPMGAVLLSSTIAATIQPGDHATTFGGGPLVASVALHVVRRLTSDTLLASVRSNGEWLGDRLAQIAGRGDCVRGVRGLGYMWGIDTHRRAREVVTAAFDAGLLLVGAGEWTIRLLPPLIATRADLSRGLDILADVLGCSRENL